MSTSTRLENASSRQVVGLINNTKSSANRTITLACEYTCSINISVHISFVLK